MNNLFVEDEKERIKYCKLTPPGYVYSVSVVVLGKNNKIPYHEHRRTHTYIEKIDGNGKIIIDGEEQELENKTFIPPRTPHTIRTDNQLSFVCLEMPPDDNDLISLET